MPAAARLGDGLATGHGCSGTTTIASNVASFTSIQGAKAAMQGSRSAVHAVPGGSSCVTHTSTIISGSTTVSIEGRAAARIGDPYEAGAVISGASNVFIGG